MNPPDETCSTPRCRNPVALSYLNRLLCQPCWRKLCDDSYNPHPNVNQTEPTTPAEDCTRTTSTQENTP